MEGKAEHLFHRTAEGRRACERADCRLQEPYRAVLAVVRHATPFEYICARLAHCPPRQIASCLDDLEAIGLVESVALEWLVELCLLGRSCAEAPSATTRA